MLNNMVVTAQKPTLRQILSVACPRCGAKPKEKCTLSTGHPSVKTHLDRDVAAGKAPPPETSSKSALRLLKGITSRGLRVLFQHK